MVQLYKTTELEAVNIMLSAIGEAPVSSLENSSLEDVTVAKNILNETIVDVSTVGYNFIASTTTNLYKILTAILTALQMPSM